MVNPVGEAVLEMCTLCEDGELAAHADELAELVGRMRASIGTLPQPMRETFTVFGGKWRTAEAIRADPTAFHDATRQLASQLGDADLLA